jgi:hypothetical protein
MKKQITIHVDIDTEATEGERGRGSTTSSRNLSDNTIYVQIRKDTVHGVVINPIFSLAHELGHMIGRIFTTPVVSMAYQAFEIAHFMGPDAQTLQAQYASEKEAWDFAEKALFQEQRDMALGSYRENAESYGVQLVQVLE